MKASGDPDRLIKAFLAEGIDELPDRSYDAVRATIEHKRQGVVIGPWRREQVSKFATYGLAAAAVVLVAVVGIRFLPTIGGVGGQPTPTPTTAPTPSPAASSVSDPSGRLQPGTYVAHPFDIIIGPDARAFTFTTPSANWEAYEIGGTTRGVVWNSGTGNSGGVGVGFLKVHSLNSDACHWTTDDDIAIGPTVDDLFEALANATNFDPGQGPYTEYADNLMGQGTELTMPSPLPSGCDDGQFRIWNAQGFDIDAQGPSNIWRLGVFDVSGERYVVLASYMPDTPDQVRNEMMSIFRSVLIDSEPGCSKYDHNCN